MTYTTFAFSRAALISLLPTAFTFLLALGFSTDNAPDHAWPSNALALQLAVVSGLVFAGVFGMELWARRHQLHAVLWSAAVLLFTTGLSLSGLTANHALQLQLLNLPFPPSDKLIERGVAVGLYVGSSVLWVTLLPHVLQRLFNLTPRNLPTLSGPLIPAALLPLLPFTLLTYALQGLHAVPTVLFATLSLALAVALLSLLVEGLLLVLVPLGRPLTDSQGLPLKPTS